jgi:hypothetical protein
MVRHSTAWSALVLAVLWLALLVFFVDLLLLMDVPQRIVAWVICGLVAAWAFWHYTKPWIGVKEDLVDVALLVEKHQHIDSDLVAALQFQEGDAPKWGSPQLESAVIEYVEEFSPSLNVFEGFTHRRFKRRMAWLLGTLAVMIALAVVFPAYAKAFANRMLLGSMRYPTDTQIERIVLNGQTVYVQGGEAVIFTGPYGMPLDFEVHCQGVLPEQGKVRLKPLDAETEVDIELHRGLAATPVSTSNPMAHESNSLSSGSQSSETASAPEAETSGEAAYRGQLPQLVGSMTYQVHLGDAWTEPLEIKVIPLPVVTVTLDPKPPAYAIVGDEEAETVREGTRQIAVVEGSDVAVNLTSNNKPLKNAILTLEDKTYPLTPLDAEGRKWTLSGAGSPLHEIRQPLRYAIQVEDEDGLSLQTPIEGYIRIRADRPPRILPPDLVTPLVLPKAKPTVDFSVSDDYGLSRLAVKVQVVRKVPMPGDDPKDMQDQVDHVTRDMILVDPKEQPKRTLTGRYALVLETFKLSPGDELKVTLEAFDYRGEFQADSALSEPLVLKVTDVQGILLGMRNTDERSAQSLDNIIEITSGDTK